MLLIIFLTSYFKESGLIIVALSAKDRYQCANLLIEMLENEVQTYPLSLSQMLIRNNIYHHSLWRFYSFLFL